MSQKPFYHISVSVISLLDSGLPEEVTVGGVKTHERGNRCDEICCVLSGIIMFSTKLVLITPGSTSITLIPYGSTS